MDMQWRNLFNNKGHIRALRVFTHVTMGWFQPISTQYITTSLCTFAKPQAYLLT